MTVYSMTGYGSASTPGGESGPSSGHSATVEARSVNGRFLDLTLRLPDEWRGLEPAIRELATAALKRGKVEMRISGARDADTAWPQPATEQLHRLSQLESSVQAWLPQARALSVNEALQWCRGGAVAATHSDEAVLTAARECLAALREARAREGARLADMLRGRLTRLRELAASAGPLIPAVVQRQQQRFIERWHEALGSVGSADAAKQIPPEALRERALTEAASYAIRIDVAEELSRLSSHLDEVERLLKAGGELGKRLDFLMQELQREANTLGSKSAALELTNLSVEMKVAIEQMREQVQNIE
jgi:uncharacterized protein (TIGR00255 family)